MVEYRGYNSYRNIAGEITDKNEGPVKDKRLAKPRRVLSFSDWWDEKLNEQQRKKEEQECKKRIDYLQTEHSANTQMIRDGNVFQKIYYSARDIFTKIRMNNLSRLERYC